MFIADARRTTSEVVSLVRRWEEEVSRLNSKVGFILYPPYMKNAIHYLGSELRREAKFLCSFWL